MRFLTACLLGLAVCVLPFASFAEDDEEEGLRTLAVQNRQYSMMHEFSGWIGTLPMDAFTKGLTFTGAYTLHFNDFIAWELGQFTYSRHLDTDLKNELNNLPQPVGPTPFEVVRMFATTSLIIKPIYGKMALLNRSLIFGEVFFTLGGGYGWMTITNRPVADVGVGFRVYAGKYVSFRIDVREYLFFTRLEAEGGKKTDVHDEFWVGLGICLGL